MAGTKEAGEHLWILVGDIHDATGNFAKIPELGMADGVIVTGDLTFNGGAEQAAKVMAALEGSCPVLFAQIGNMDLAAVDGWLDGQGRNLHARAQEIAPGVVIFGVGGSTPTPFNTPSEFPESSYEAWLADLWEKAKDAAVRVLISHNPPKDTACDVIGGGVHVGSTAVRAFLEKAQPELCVCGHIHEARAVDRVGRTLVINPGDLASGGYVLLRADGGGRFSAEMRIVAAG